MKTIETKLIVDINLKNSTKLNVLQMVYDGICQFQVYIFK